MVDTTLDALLEAVCVLLQIVADMGSIQDPEWGKLLGLRDKLDILIAKRKGPG